MTRKKRKILTMSDTPAPTMSATALLTHFANSAQSGGVTKVVVMAFTDDGRIVSAGSEGLTTMEGCFLCETTKAQILANNAAANADD